MIGTTDAAKAIAFNQRIMGGNLASTLAGEFSFTLAIAFALFFFGTLAMALRTRVGTLWLPAALLALCLMSHLMVGIFARSAPCRCGCSTSAREPRTHGRDRRRGVCSSARCGSCR